MTRISKERRLSGRFAVLFIGLLAGGSAGAAMHVWLGATQITVATFVMVGYMAGALTLVRRVWRFDSQSLEQLRSLEINRPTQRLRRLVADRQFWLSTGIGVACLGGAAWYGGLREPRMIALVAAAWTLLDVLLSYDLTVLHPTTRCRRCHYQLMPFLNPADPHQRVRCTECGAVWSKEQLCLTPTESHAETRGAAAIP